jgi:hypothetical protein
MTIFICTKKGCPNEGVIYNFGDEQPARAECGGCHETLLPQEEATNG